ncbi:MAG TPA: YlxM family DNA-binding protein [Candidatus Fimivivens faecavium]|nr:YlxM family DNA-binding protein [Candidatus Fimivivens faecavium]
MAKDLEISVLYDFYGDMLTEKQQEVIELYYNEDLSLAEIAAHSHITRQGVRDSIKRAEAQLREFEEMLGLAERFHEFRDAFLEISKSAKEIGQINSKFYFSKEIADRAGKIESLTDRLLQIE